MQNDPTRRRVIALGCSAAAASACAGRNTDTMAATLSYAISGALWFDGGTFVSRPGYVEQGRFTFRRPARIDSDLDLTGAHMVPPFADAHNHGIGTGVEERDRAMIASYLSAGVFYMQSHGNLPLSASEKQRLDLNAPQGLDAVFAQGSITGPGGHPMGLIRDVLLPRGFFPGQTLETLRDRRFFEVSSDADLRAKWPLIQAAGGDFVKFFLVNSEHHGERRDDPDYFGRRGLDPALAPLIVGRAHADGKRASAHVASAADFRTALASGADIIAHVPEVEITQEDARQAAERGVIVITTCAFLARQARNTARPIADIQTRNLRLLRDAGVHLAIGSDDPADPTPGEIAYLKGLRVFSDGELLALWTNATARAIFPGRRIGSLSEGYEASFLALETNPLVEAGAQPRIRLRFKQGVPLSP